MSISYSILNIYYFVCLFGVLRRFQHCTGHITTGTWKGRGNQYIEFARVLYCKLPTNGKLLPTFPLQSMMGIEPRPQRWDARVLPLCDCAPPPPPPIFTCLIFLRPLPTLVSDPKFIHLATGLSVNFTACRLHFPACQLIKQACL